MRELPESLSRLTGLHTLQIDNNPITYLPPWIGSLARLRELRASDIPRLTEVPEKIGLLTKLTKLDLKRTRCTRDRIPESVARLPNLEHIYTSLS